MASNRIIVLSDEVWGWIGDAVVLTVTEDAAKALCDGDKKLRDLTRDDVINTETIS